MWDCCDGFLAMVLVEWNYLLEFFCMSFFDNPNSLEALPLISCSFIF